MKKRVITISAIVAGIIILGLFFLWVLLPRIMLYKIVNSYLPNVDKSAEYFTDFNIANNDVQTIDNGYVSVKIPNRFIHNEEKAELIPCLYNTSDNSETIFFMSEKGDLSGLNLLDPEMYKDIDGVPPDIGVKEITKGFESIGKGLPDSAYNTYKLMLLINKDDYSFWNLNKGVCFSIAAVMKEILISNYDKMYLYEKDNIRGIIEIEEKEDIHKVVFEIYNSDDLDTVYTLVIGVKNIDDAYAIINSAEFI